MRRAAQGHPERFDPPDGARQLAVFRPSGVFRPGQAEIHRPDHLFADRKFLRPGTAGGRQAGRAAQGTCRRRFRLHFPRQGLHAGDSDHGADHHAPGRLRVAAAGRPRLQDRPLCGAHRLHARKRLHHENRPETGPFRTALHLHRAQPALRREHGFRRRQGGRQTGRLDRSGRGE